VKPGVLAPVRRGFLADAKLVCCKLLQQTVLAPHGVVVSSVDAGDIVKFDAEVMKLDRRPYSAGHLGMMPYLSQRGIFESLLSAEDDRAAARKHITESGTP